MKLKIFAMIAAMAFAAPLAAEAAPAGGLTANNFASVAAPQATDAAVVPGGPAAKVEKVWWRGRGWGGRGWGWRGGYGGWRGGYGWRGYGWGWRRPYWRRRFWYY